MLGLMDQPYTRERFFAGRTGGARWRGPDGTIKKLKTRKDIAIADAVLAATSPDLFKPGDEARRFKDLSARAKMTRYGGDCYAYCLLAAGHVDLVVEAGLKAVDIVPLIPIIEQAGGVVTTWDGGAATKGGRIVAAGDPRLHAAAVKLLSA